MYQFPSHLLSTETDQEGRIFFLLLVASIYKSNLNILESKIKRFCSTILESFIHTRQMRNFNKECIKQNLANLISNYPKGKIHDLGIGHAAIGYYMQMPMPKPCSNQLKTICHSPGSTDPTSWDYVDLVFILHYPLLRLHLWPFIFHKLS